MWKDAAVAQLAEQPPCKRQVVGSTPTGGFERLTMSTVEVTIDAEEIKDALKLSYKLPAHADIEFLVEEKWVGYGQAESKKLAFEGAKITFEKPLSEILKT